MWVYGQTEVQKDLVAAREAGGQEVHYEVADTALHDLETDRPSVTFTDADGRRRPRGRRRRRRLRRLVRPVARRRPGGGPQTWEKVYPYSWLGILADVAPSTDELIYAWHPDGFALHSMRSATVSRLYLQVPNDTPSRSGPTTGSGRRWPPGSATARTAGRSTPGPDHREVACCRCARSSQTPMRHGRLFLAGDAAHIVPPTGAKGLNLAVRDVGLLAPALVDLVRKDDQRSRTPTPTPRCAGSGAARTSPGG